MAKKRNKKTTRKKKVSVKIVGDAPPEPVGDIPEQIESPPEPVGDCPEPVGDHSQYEQVGVAVHDAEEGGVCELGCDETGNPCEDCGVPEKTLEEIDQECQDMADSRGPSILVRLVRLAQDVARGTDHIVSDSYSAQVYGRIKYTEDNQKHAAKIIADMNDGIGGVDPNEN